MTCGNTAFKNKQLVKRLLHDTKHRDSHMRQTGKDSKIFMLMNSNSTSIG